MSLVEPGVGAVGAEKTAPRWPSGLRRGWTGGPHLTAAPSPHQGQEMARAVGAVAYLECSALLQENVQAVFQEAAEVALSSRSRNFWRRITRSFCVLT